MTALRLRPFLLGLLLTSPVLLGAGLTVFGEGVGGGIKGTKHDLSADGPGPWKANENSQVCKFCHIPHSAAPGAPLWNRADGGRTYQVYGSSTAGASPTQPNGSSRQCLSCHDGAVALGAVLRGKPIRMATGRERLTGRGRVGSDLRDDHPVGISYSQAHTTAPGLRASPSLPVKLDSQGRVQCSSCHDVHDDSNGQFLVQPDTNGGLCLSCHAPQGWTASTHATSNATLTTNVDDPWGPGGGTVADKACRGCHTPHHAGRPERLLNRFKEEENCLSCHNGWVAKTDLRQESGKLSGHHAAATTGVHDPTEDPATMPRHVECSDCHNPHEVTSDHASPGPTSGALSGRLRGARGVSDTGGRVERVSTEREVCFRCHGDHAPPSATRIVRQVDERSIRRKFDPGNASAHPVRGVRGAGSVSLRSPWTSSSRMSCTSCHNNDSGPAVGGSGPRGPHGSRWPFLLEKRYDTADRTTEGPASYALCYGCHDRGSIMGDQSFPEHRRHVAQERIPCSACHDPHGVAGTTGPGSQHQALINFDTWIVRPVGQTLEFTSTGPGEGNCTVSCHGVDHVNTPYSR